MVKNLKNIMTLSFIFFYNGFYSMEVKIFYSIEVNMTANDRNMVDFSENNPQNLIHNHFKKFISKCDNAEENIENSIINVNQQSIEDFDLLNDVHIHSHNLDYEDNPNNGFLFLNNFYNVIYFIYEYFNNFHFYSFFF
jgi:hypothetical protein